MSPAAFGAVTLRCVRLVSPEAPGWHETRPAGAPCSWERSLWAAVCISDPINAICHNSHPAKRHSAPCVHLNYSIPEAFVNGFSTNFTAPRCGLHGLSRRFGWSRSCFLHSTHKHLLHCSLHHKPSDLPLRSLGRLQSLLHRPIVRYRLP